MSGQRSGNDDAFGISRVGDTVALRQLSAVKASRNVIDDIDLTWREYEYGAGGIPPTCRECRLASKPHLIPREVFRLPRECTLPIPLTWRKTLILYQARVCRDWYDKLKHNEGLN